MSMILLAAMMMSGDPVVAQQQPSAAAAQVAPAPKKAKEKKICKAGEPVVGSHMSMTVCLTQREWDMQGSGVNLGDRSGSSTSQEHYR
jgi:hypothetical protein